MSDTIMVPTIGEYLRKEFMDPFHLSAYRLAKDIGVPVSRIQAILHDRRKITADTSLRLARYFGVSDRFFLDIQNDLEIRKLKREMEEELSGIQPIEKQ